MMCCKNTLFVILIVSIGFGNGEGNENLDSRIKGMESNFFKMNQAIEARMEAMENNFLKMNQASEARMEAKENNFLKVTQAIDQFQLKLDLENIPTYEGLAPTKVTPVPKMNNTDLETRVQALEFQVANVQEDVIDIEAEVTNIEGEITNIEGGIINIEGQITIINAGQLNQNDKIDNLEDVSEGLDTRVTTLEDEDGSDESVTEAINKLNSDVLYLNETVEVLDSRLETLEALDVSAEIENLDSRLDALELDGTVAFHVGLTEDRPMIPIGGVAVWDYIFFNLGDGYNILTGDFVVPQGQAGLYYFNVHLLFVTGEDPGLAIRHNGENLCMAYEDNRQSGDFGGSACGAVVQLAEDDIVDVFYIGGTDNTPCQGRNF